LLLKMGFVICSKDDDFHRLVSARGYRSKLVHLALGNVTNDQILSALLAAADDIQSAFGDTTTGSVVLTCRPFVCATTTRLSSGELCDPGERAAENQRVHSVRALAGVAMIEAARAVGWITQRGHRGRAVLVADYTG